MAPRPLVTGASRRRRLVAWAAGALALQVGIALARIGGWL